MERVDLPEVWPHEAADFTPWLAQNLDQLGAALGLDLQTAWARFSAAGRNAVARVAFGPEGEFLMGATTLEDLGLVVDPIDRRLIPQEDLLMPAAGF